jgi:hypothetical protein
LEPLPRQSALPRLESELHEIDALEPEFDHSPSLPPEMGSFPPQWADFSGAEATRSSSAPPPRTSGFVLLKEPRWEVDERLWPSEPPIARAVPAPSRGPSLLMGAAGLLLLAASVGLTLIDQRAALDGGATSLAIDLRPPTWVAAVVCIVGAGCLVIALGRLARGRGH